MKIYSFFLLLFALRFTTLAQLSSASDDLEFSNTAYHTDANVPGKSYKASSLNMNLCYFGFNTSIATEFSSKLRFQQALGSWKIGFQANYQNLIQIQKNAEIGLSLAKDFAISRNWSVRPAIGANALSSSFPYDTGTDLRQIYDINTGLQIRYKGWQLYGGINSILSTQESIQINDTLFILYQRQPHAHIGIKKTFQIDSLRHIDAALFYENYLGYSYVNTSVIYRNQKELFLLGYSTRQLNLGCGLILPKQQQIMVALNLQRFSMLQNDLRPGFQLNYKRQLMQRASQRSFTGTPSF
jgi:hypothetical protein